MFLVFKMGRGLKSSEPEMRIAALKAIAEYKLKPAIKYLDTVNDLIQGDEERDVRLQAIACSKELLRKYCLAGLFYPFAQESWIDFFNTAAQSHDDAEVSVSAAAALSALAKEFADFVAFDIPDMVRIGSLGQVWTSKNLRISNFRNGDVIFQAKSSDDWVMALKEQKPAWCYYGFGREHLGSEYGKLYNYFTVKDPRSIAPNGWHIPNDEEWKELADSYFGTSLKEVGRSHWPINVGADFDCGFTALPGGGCNEDGQSWGWGNEAHYWSSSPRGDKGSFWSIFYSKAEIKKFEASKWAYGNILRMAGCSIRLVRDF